MHFDPEFIEEKKLLTGIKKQNALRPVNFLRHFPQNESWPI